MCLSPNIRDSVRDIKTETVEVQVAMNGVDFTETSDAVSLVFVGKGEGTSALIYLMAVLLVVLLLASVLAMVYGLRAYYNAKES